MGNAVVLLIFSHVRGIIASVPALFPHPPGVSRWSVIIYGILAFASHDPGRYRSGAEGPYQETRTQE